MQNFNCTLLEGVIIEINKMELTNFNTPVFIFKIRSELKSRTGDNTFLNMKIFTYNQLAETCSKYLKIGSRVLISGVLTPDGLDSEKVNLLTGAK